MLTHFIAKLLGKKLYKAEVIIESGSFTADSHSDSITEALKWVLHGIHEAYESEPNDTGSANHGVFGKISEFKLLNITKNSIGILCYSKPKNEDIMFMTNRMVYIPETILKLAKEGDFNLQSNFKK
tara:strand:+ start:88 stop:465 length:378 start_codon:yes stop_codon:yes gene_type:complete